MEVFKDYLEGINNAQQRERVEEVFGWVANTFPNLSPRLAWSQPMFTAHETFIIGFSISQKHLAVTPEIAGIEHFSNEIIEAGYEHSKNLFRIKWEDAVNYPLLEKMIAYNIDDKSDCTTFWRK